jgi:hypothetical protein
MFQDHFNFSLFVSVEGTCSNECTFVSVCLCNVPCCFYFIVRGDTKVMPLVLFSETIITILIKYTYHFFFFLKQS